MSEEILEKLCDKIVDVIHDSFPSKNFLVKISQAKNGTVYLIVRKKHGRFICDGKKEFEKKKKLVLFLLYLIFIVKTINSCQIIILLILS